MMGVGLLFMLLIGLVVIGLPLLVVALVAGGGLASLLKPRPQNVEPEAPPLSHGTAYIRKCPTCGRGVKADWNVCPSCGAALA
ncbi:MAG TPA: zinc-ribbon domain-containing protein [Anaerolineales bacterium]|nr:zinc-ribbon domain-containing protein [Anaerolineales bacterium]